MRVDASPDRCLSAGKTEAGKNFKVRDSGGSVVFRRMCRVYDVVRAHDDS